MTLNVVLKAKGDRNGRASDHLLRDRAALARAALRSGATEQTEGEGRPARLDRPENIDRIETNLQIAHAPKSAVRDFRTDYLLKVFRYDAQARMFEEAPMENQIDRERILADDSLRREFKAWLLDPGISPSSIAARS